MSRGLTGKQLYSFRDSYARINIWQGAVRSGKSFSSLLRFIQYIAHGPKGDFIIVGRTVHAIKRNIVIPLQSLLGPQFQYFSGKAEAKLWGRTIHVIGANDERAEGKIRGATFAGAYVDEITLIPESFFIMLLSRLSVKGSKLFGTTNPDGPYHWLKLNYLDRKEELNLKQWHFTIEDNPSLDPEYIDSLKKEYTGLWYKRFIEGLWVLAEGTVYDMFDENKHVIRTFPAAEYYLVGIDYGTHNPTVFCLIGVNEKSKPKAWLEREYYYDSRQTHKQKTDSEYADDLKGFLGKIQPRKIYLDPSAASFKLELRKKGFTFVTDANNDVLDGIRTQSKMLSSGEYQIGYNCTNTIQEYGSYIWDQKATNYGEDKPLKNKDHCLDSSRYVLHTHFSQKGIDYRQFSAL